MHWPAWTEAWCSSTSGQFPGQFPGRRSECLEIKKSRPGRGMAPVKAKNFSTPKSFLVGAHLVGCEEGPPHFQFKNQEKQSSFVVVAIRCRRSLNSLFLFIFSWFPSFFWVGGLLVVTFLVMLPTIIVRSPCPQCAGWAVAKFPIPNAAVAWGARPLTTPPMAVAVPSASAWRLRVIILKERKVCFVNDEINNSA